MIVREIEENDKVRSVYGGSVEQAAFRNLARSCAPKPGRVPKPGRRSHAEARPGRVRRRLAAGRVPKPGPAPVTARRGPARPGRTARCGPVRPGPARPGPARPGPARPGPTRPGPARPGQARPGPARPGPARPGPARPGPARPGPARPGPARPGPARPGPARPCRPPGSAGGGRETGKTDSTTVEITCACRRMTGRVVLSTYGNKSRKTTKSDPSTGDQF